MRPGILRHGLWLVARAVAMAVGLAVGFAASENGEAVVAEVRQGLARTDPSTPESRPCDAIAKMCRESLKFQLRLIERLSPSTVEAATLRSASEPDFVLVMPHPLDRGDMQGYARCLEIARSCYASVAR